MAGDFNWAAKAADQVHTAGEIHDCPSEGHEETETHCKTLTRDADLHEW